MESQVFDGMKSTGLVQKRVVHSYFFLLTFAFQIVRCDCSEILDKRQTVSDYASFPQNAMNAFILIDNF